MLDQTEIDALRASAMVMRESKKDASNMFYDTLFEQSPDLRGLFPAQMTDQARKFSATLVVAVNSLSNWKALQPIIEALARRHLTYGVTMEHYDVVGKALVETLRKLGTSSADIAIWTKVYALLADHMKATAYPAAD